MSGRGVMQQRKKVVRHRRRALFDPSEARGLHAVGEESDTREGGLKMVGPSELLAHQLCQVTETRRFSAFLCGKKSLAKVPADKAI